MDENGYYGTIMKNYGIDRNQFSDNESYVEAVKNAVKADSNKDNKYLETFDSFVDKSYNDQLQVWADKAAEADSQHLVLMKSAKKDYITEQLRIAREQGEEYADAPTIQNLQEAAGVLDAYADNSDYDFTYETKDDQGKVIESGRLTGAGLLAGDYDKLDSANNHMKAKQTENVKALSKNQSEGAAARANAGK